VSNLRSQRGLQKSTFGAALAAPFCSTSSGDDAMGAGGSDSTDIVSYKRGQEIECTVLQFGPLGASVSIDGDKARGLVLQKEISMFRDRRGTDVLMGETIPGFVERVRDDGRIHVFLRPVDRARVGSVAEQIMDALEGSPDMTIPVGDKSLPDDISAYFYGVSKRDFKIAVGSLYKEGKVKPGSHMTELLSDEKQEEASERMRKKNDEFAEKKSYSKKNDEDKTIFIGNLPFTVTEKAIINAVSKVLGPDSVVNVRLALDENEKPRGFGYVELQSADDVDIALNKLKGIQVVGRKMRVDYANKDRKSSSNAVTGMDTQEESAIKTKIEATLYIGNLSYDVSEEDIVKFVSGLENISEESVASVRMGTDKNTGKSKGFAHVDFYLEDDAKNVYENLHETMLLNRKVFIDDATK
tara:strand:+ start:65 stop:1300 length:1236 start_codon:yes stop_codon:yes gene_type:complete